MPQEGLERTVSPSPSVTQLGLPSTVTRWQNSSPEVMVRLLSTVGGAEGTRVGAEVGATVAVGLTVVDSTGDGVVTTVQQSVQPALPSL